VYLIETERFFTVAAEAVTKPRPWPVATPGVVMVAVEAPVVEQVRAECMRGRKPRLHGVDPGSAEIVHLTLLEVQQIEPELAFLVNPDGRHHCTFLSRKTAAPLVSASMSKTL
jgi:hypothetical protein